METILKKGRIVINIKPKITSLSHNYSNVNLFVKDYSEMFDKADLLLDLDNFYNSNKKSVLAKRFKKVVELWNQGDSEYRSEFCAIKFFINDLEIIKKHSDQIFSGIRRDLIRQKYSQSWQGLRFEIHVLASLLQKEINFNKQESPDFSIKFKQHNLYIEATSARLEKSKGLSHYKKIEYAISEKSSKPYANKNTALFIDITNIVFNESKIDEKGDFEQLMSSIHENDNNNYGSVILFTFRMNYDLGHYESVFRRVDITGCSDYLVEFLDTIYPNKEFLSVPNSFEFVHSA